MTKLFGTKVCGIRTSDDFLGALDGQVEAIGLNFVPESPRFISPDAAAAMYAQVRLKCERENRLPSGLKLVGVFVNPKPADVREVIRHIPLDYVQLHGEEEADDWRDFEDLPLIKAIRWSGCVEQQLMLTRWHQFLGARLVAFLVDAASTDVRGGSGLKADWHSLVPRPPVLAGKPLILAGGLTPENVSEAILTVMPHAVDTASGVEKSPGVKDLHKMREFVLRAKQAWNRKK